MSKSCNRPTAAERQHAPAYRGRMDFSCRFQSAARCSVGKHLEGCMPDQEYAGFVGLEPTTEDIVRACAKTGREVDFDDAREILDRLDRDELSGVLIRAIESSSDLDEQVAEMIDGIAAMIADDAPSPSFR